MSASWNNPALINKISDDVPAIKNLLIALFKMTDSNTEDVPTDAKRLYSVSGGVQFQKYTGTAWTSIGKLIHDVDMLDGKHAKNDTTPNTIPIRNSSGQIEGDITGNANTATTAASVATGYVVPVINGGTGASDEAGARASLGTNNAANIDQGVLKVAHGGTGSSIQNFVDLSTNQTIGGNKTFSGEVTLNKNVLKMTVLDTTEGATAERTDTVLQGISSNSGYGITALFGASGNAVIGAGEGKDDLLAELAGNAGENVYIIADGNIVFHPNAATYSSKKTITLNASGELSGLAKVTATSFVGTLTGDCTGNAGSATRLATPRTLYVALGTTYDANSPVTFDGQAAKALPVTGTLPLARGGTGLTASPSLLVNLASTAAANVMAASPRPGVTGVLPVAHGGTGSSTKNFVDLSSAQNIGATKNFTKNQKIYSITGYTSQDTFDIMGYGGTSAPFVQLWPYNMGSSDPAGTSRKGSLVLCANNGSSSKEVTLTVGGFWSEASIMPYETNTYYLGSSSYRWKNLYISASAISTSDKRMKSDVSNIPDSVLDAWGSIEFKKFKMNDSIKKKGKSKARLHIGLIAQDIGEAMTKAGIKPEDYSLYCHDSWEATPDVRSKTGRLIAKAKPAGDMFSLRYEEALCMEAAYQRRRADRAERRLEDLERRLSALEQR